MARIWVGALSGTIQYLEFLREDHTGKSKTSTADVSHAIRIKLNIVWNKI